MKRYIRCTTVNNNVFDTSSTGTSYYDRLLNDDDLKYMQEAKNLTGKIVMMTPDEYFSEASFIFDDKFSVDDLRKQRSDSSTDKYVKDMLNGEKFPLCFLDYAYKGQEGLHRMLAAKIAFGPDVKHPVLVITPYDQEKWDEWKLMQEISYLERYDLCSAAEEMERSLSDWSYRPPKDLTVRAKNFIEKFLADKGVNATVDCTVREYDEDPRLDVTLTSYEGHDVEDADPVKSSPWLGNMFDLAADDDGSDDDTDLDDIDIDLDDIDEDDLDIDIADFFLK